MAISNKHKFTCAIPDDPVAQAAGEVLPSHYNDEHDLILGTGMLIGRTTAGTGAAEEVPIADFATAAQGALADTAVQPADLAAVATTGDYNDLINTPAGGGDFSGPASSTDSALVRFDGAGGKTGQDSGITVSDVSGASVTLASTAGNALAVNATAPAAANGASQAGKSLTVTASAAVASLDTAGAAAGGSVTITAGAAARNTSGNADGGGIELAGGAGIGTGVTGQVKITNAGSAARPSLHLSTGTNTGWYQPTSEAWGFSAGASAVFLLFASGLRTVSTGVIGWSSGAPTSANDCGLARNAAGVVEVNSGAKGTLRDLRLRNVRTDATTVAGLVAAATAGAGARGFVTDANSATFGAAAVGGGANAMPVWCDGAGWFIG